jgi:hypothetical protein
MYPNIQMVSTRAGIRGAFKANTDMNVTTGVVIAFLVTKEEMGE